MNKKSIIFIYILCLAIYSFSAVTLDTVNVDDPTDNDEIYGDKTSVQISIRDDIANGNGTINVSPALPGNITQAQLIDSNSDGYYEIQGLANNTIYTEPLTSSSYNLSVTVNGNSKSITIYIDKTNPVISSVNISSSRGNVFTAGDNVTITCQVSDSHIIKSGIQADLRQISGNSSHNRVECNSFSAGVATWNVSAGTGLTDGDKQIIIYTKDQAGNEKIDNSGSIYADYSELNNVTLISPTNGIVSNDSTPELSWNDLGQDEIKYILEISSNTDFTNILHSYEITDVDGQSTYTYSVPDTLGDGFYSWQVYGVDGADHQSAHRPGSTANETRTIEIDTVAPVISSFDSENSDPEAVFDNDEVYKGGTLVSLWVKSAYPADELEFNVSINSAKTGYSSNPQPITTHDGSGKYVYNWNTVGISDSDDYVVNMSLKDKAQNEDSRTLTITIDAEAPGKVTLVSPIDETKVNTLTPQFSWNDLGQDESKYILQIDDNNNFGSPLILTGAANIGPDTTTYTVSGGESLDENMKYYWRVYAEDAEGNFKPSIADVFSFTCDTTPPSLIESNPLDGALNVSRSLNILITMNEALDPSTVNDTNVKLQLDDGGFVDQNATITYSDTSGFFIKVQPQTSMRFSANYRVVLSTNITDVAGNNLETETIISFTVQDMASITGVTVMDNPKDNGGKLKVSWTSLGTLDNFQKYSVFYKEGAEPVNDSDIGTLTTFIDITDISSEEVVIDGLDNSLQYTVAVIAYTDYGARSVLNSDSQAGPATPLDDAVICQDSTKSEIRPVNVAPDATIEYSLYIKPLFLTDDLGFNKIIIGTQNHTLIDVSQSKLTIDETEYVNSATPVSGEYNAVVNGDTIEITVGNIIDYNVVNSKRIMFTFKADSPASLDVQSEFIIKVGETDIDKFVYVYEGFADSNNFNENSLTSITANTINNISAEMNPEFLGLNSTYDVTMNILPEIENGNIGFDKVLIDMPDNYSVSNISQWKLYNGSTFLSETVFDVIDNDTVEITLPFEINYSSQEKTLKVDMQIGTPATSDASTGSAFGVFVNNSAISKLIPVNAGDANETGAGDSNSLTIYSASPANQLLAEIQPFKGGIESIVDFKMVLMQQLDPNLHTGSDKFYITVPAGFSQVKVESPTNVISGKDRDYSIITTGRPAQDQALVTVYQPDSVKDGTIEVLIGEKYTYNVETFEIEFSAKLPDTAGDYTFALKGGNGDISDYLNATAQNVDGNSSNNNNPDELTINVTSPVQNIYAEISPHVMSPNQNKDISVFMQIHTGAGSGVDRIIIEPDNIASFSIDPLNTSLNIAGIDYNIITTGDPLVNEAKIYTDENNSNKIMIDLGSNKITGDNIICIYTFNVDASNVEDAPDGTLWNISVDDTSASHPIAAQAKDLDNDSANGNSIYMFTGYALKDSHPYGEIYVLSSDGTEHFADIKNAVKAGSTRNKFYYTVKPSYIPEDIGINNIKINTVNHSINDITSVSVNAGGNEFTNIYSGTPSQSQALINYSSPTLEITLGTKLYKDNPSDSRIMVYFEADAPVLNDNGEEFACYLDYTYLNSKVKVLSGDAGALDPTSSNIVITKQSPVAGITSEIVPVDVNTSRTKEKFTLSFKPEINAFNSFFSKISVEIPDSYTNIYVDTSNDALNESKALSCDIHSIKSVTIDPQNEGDAKIFVSGNTIQIILANSVYDQTYNNSKWDLEFFANTPSSSDLLNNSDPLDDGKEFKVLFDNRVNSLPVYSNAGEVNGDASSAKMKVICAPSALSMIAEAKAVSQNGVSFVDNKVIADSPSNIFTVSAIPELSDKTRGINRLKIFIPGEFSNPYFRNLKIGENNVSPTNSIAQINNSDHLDIRFSNITNINTIKVEFECDVDNISLSQQDLEVYGYYDDASYEVKATSGNTGSGINTQSLSFDIINVPARGAVAEIDDASIVINKDQEHEFNIYITPNITVNDSGIDIVQLYMPSENYSQISVEGVEWNGNLLARTSNSNPGSGEYYTQTSSGSFYIKSGNKITEDNKLIKIRFKVKAPDITDIPDGNKFNGFITDSLNSDVHIALIEGNSDNTQINNSLNVKVSSAVKSALAEITPSYAVKGQTGVLFEYTIKSEIVTQAYGFNKISLAIPEGFTLRDETSLQITDISTGNTVNYTPVTSNPVGAQYVYSVTNNNMIFEMDASNPVDYSNKTVISFKADIPNLNIVDDVICTLYNENNNVSDNPVAGNANDDDTDWNTIAVSSSSAEISDISAKAEYIQDGSWKVKLKLNFNTTMDVESTTPYIKVDDIKAVTVKYENINGLGVWEGYVWINSRNFAGSIDIRVNNAKDLMGNWVSTTILTQPVQTGVAAGLFKNPVDSKMLTIIARASSELPAGHYIVAQVKETGYSVQNITLESSKNSKIFKGTYRVISSENIDVTMVVYDNNNNVLSSPSRFKVSQFNKDEIIKIDENHQVIVKEVFDNNTFIRGSALLDFSDSTTQELSRISDIISFDSGVTLNIQKNVSEKNSGLYLYYNNKWNASELYQGEKVYGIGMFEEKNAPVLKSLPVQKRDDMYEFELEDISGIKQVKVFSDSIEYYTNIHDGKVNFIKNDKTPIITIVAEDNRNNTLIKKVLLKAPALTGNMKVYPNPADLYATFDSSDTADYSLKIYDTSGKLIFKNRNNNGIYNWMLIDKRGNDVANGVYFYKVTYTNGTEINGKIVVLR